MFGTFSIVFYRLDIFDIITQFLFTNGLLYYLNFKGFYLGISADYFFSFQNTTRSTDYTKMKNYYEAVYKFFLNMFVNLEIFPSYEFTLIITFIT